MADSAAAERRIQIPATAPEVGQTDAVAAAAAPEKWLNYFVRFLALVERAGNALGTLAFAWATIVLLGGYPSVLKKDFGIATAIIFLEGTRTFTRENRLDQDYRLFFRTTGAFRPLGWNGLIVVVYFSIGMLSTLAWNVHQGKGEVTARRLFAIMLLLFAAGQFLYAVAPIGPRLRLLKCNRLRRPISLFSPVVAILLLAPSLFMKKSSGMAMWISYVMLVVIVLLVTISRLQFPIIIHRVQCALGRKHVFWCQFILNSCMLAAIVMSVLLTDKSDRSGMIGIVISAFFIVSFGNLQIPAAVVRVLLATLSLKPQGYDGHESATNLVRSLNIFYGMVLGQGMLYIVAGILEVFSFIPRKCLVHRGGFTGQWGVESVKLYYEDAFAKCMEGGVFLSKSISLSNFAMDYLNSDSSKNQLYGIRMMHIFLQSDPTREQLLKKLNISAQTMARLISMLDLTSRNDHPTIRLYAAKVIVELAKSLRVVTVPGVMQIISTLLDADDKPKRGHPLLDEDDDRVNTVERQETGQDAAGYQEQTQETLGDTDKLLQTQNRSTHNNNQNFIFRCWQKISEYWSIPKEQPLTDHDLLPALGMSIIYSLADCDQNNCVQINRVTDLIPKIIGFTSFRSSIVNSKAHQKVLVMSSLKVLQGLTSIEGEIGITLRYKISKHPFLLRNLAEILGDSNNTQESRKLVAGILRNLAIDRDTRQEIGHKQVLITRLIKAFLSSSGPSSSNVDCLLPKVAGQALAMLAAENVHNCLVMLKEPQFINELKNMILVHDHKCIYVAASLLRNLCLHAQPQLTESDLKELSQTLREVLERIMDAEGAELEIFIGLSSQICKVIPEEFTQELEHGQIKRRFVKRLVDALNANMKPTAHCPGIRRVILEQSIYMMECNSHYANCFNEYEMMDALFMVVETSSSAENYMVFLGDTGFMECNTPLLALVDRAKELMGVSRCKASIVTTKNNCE
uniref:BLE2 protein n=1 Tax=Leersia perrieri TaxID=77586 RepID=A0A0D9X2B5_9ORYZ